MYAIKHQENFWLDYACMVTKRISFLNFNIYNLWCISKKFRNRNACLMDPQLLMSAELLVDLGIKLKQSSSKTFEFFAGSWLCLISLRASCLGNQRNEEDAASIQQRKMDHKCWIVGYKLLHSQAHNDRNPCVEDSTGAHTR